METKNEIRLNYYEVLKKLELHNSRKTELRDIINAMLKADNCELYEADIYAFGAAKRTFNTISGFKLLVENFNMICTRALLRTQLIQQLDFLPCL